MLGGVGEVGLGVAAAETGERLPLGELVLAAVLGQLDRAELLAEGRVEAAGADRGQLARVTDEDRFPLGTLDLSRSGASTRVSAIPASSTTSTQPCGRPPSRSASSRSRCRVQLGIPVAVCELVGGPAARRRAHHLHAACAIDLVERLESGRLAGAGDADDADDPIAAERRLPHQPLLLARQPAVEERPEHGPPVRGRCADVAARGRERERFPFDLEQLPGREPCRPARNVARLDLLDAGKAGELVRGREHLLSRGAVCGASRRRRGRAPAA